MQLRHSLKAGRPEVRSKILIARRKKIKKCDVGKQTKEELNLTFEVNIHLVDGFAYRLTTHHYCLCNAY
ncbi:MAG: hypothetical protein ACUZ8N_10780 [Candidatus Scalindua sp.]